MATATTTYPASFLPLPAPTDVYRITARDRLPVVIDDQEVGRMAVAELLP